MYFFNTTEHFVKGHKLSQIRRRNKSLADFKLYNDNIVIDNTPMYLINLDRRPDRLKITMNLLQEKGYDNVHRIPAIDSSNPAIWNDIKKYVAPDSMDSIQKGWRTEHHQLSKGAVGCYLSHLEIWKIAAEDDTDMIIFEDDTYPSLTKDTLQSYLNDVPPNWDIVLFGGYYDTNYRIVNKRISHVDRFYGTHAYMISSRACKFLIPKALPITKQVDSFLSDQAVGGFLNIYGLRNTGWIQNQQIAGTDIQTPLRSIEALPIHEDVMVHDV